MQCYDRKRRRLQSYGLQEPKLQSGFLLGLFRTVGATWKFLVSFPVPLITYLNLSVCKKGITAIVTTRMKLKRPGMLKNNPERRYNVTCSTVTVT